MATRIPPMTDHHMATPLLRSAMADAFAAAGPLIEKTRRAVFRSRDDIAPITLAAHWQVATGRFSWVPREQLGAYFEIGYGPLERIEQAVNSRKHPQICVNDGGVDDYEVVGARIRAAFARRWPEPSSFELFDAIGGEDHGSAELALPAA